MRRMVEAGTIAARRVLQEFSIHDLESHGGRQEEKKDRYHAHKLRTICETVKTRMMTATIVTVVTGFLVGMWQLIQGNGWPK